MEKDINFEIEEDIIRTKYNLIYKELYDNYINAKMDFVEKHIEDMRNLRKKYKILNLQKNKNE